ncbi:glycosyltransferase family 2 protein [Microbacterium sp. NPDC016588]
MTRAEGALITILVPLYNEDAVLPLLYRRVDEVTAALDRYRFEFLFVDDGSSDGSLEMVRALARADDRVRYVALSRNFGKEPAIMAGLDATRGDCVVILDADLQDPPELVPRMIAHWEEGFDDVFARRESRAGETWMKRWTSKMFYRVLERSTDIAIQKDTGDFRLLDRRCVDALRTVRESERYTKGLFDWIGFSKKEITYARDARAAGVTKWSYPRLVNFAVDGLTSFTTAPLRWSTGMGFVVSTAALIYMVVIIVRGVLGIDPVAGYPSLMAVILFLGGIQLISLGIIGEYLARVFNETKRRPLYILKESGPRPDSEER